MAILFAALAALAGCSYKGGDIGDPFHRKFHWASFVKGEDIAQTCDASAPDRFRLVYNAIWGEQVRVYEWDSIRESLRIRVVGGGNLRDMTLGDPLAAWRAAEASVPLDRTARDGLVRALAEAKAFGPPAVGLELPSRSYYWASASCYQGRFTFTGWAYPSVEFDAARFPAALFAQDPGRDTVRPPAAIPMDVMYEYDKRRGAVMEFTLRVDAPVLGK
ncbi:hypothetical protein [Paramagnetospirillum marisnigri]|nr:hypothetical protein [Paramagnetospirillum marisnigri]